MARINRCYPFLDHINNFSNDWTSYPQVKIMLDYKNKIKNKKILVYGFGISGKACFHYLKKKNKVFIYDDNEKKVPSIFKKHKIIKKKIFRNDYDLIVISPGINKKNCGLARFIQKNENKIITDLDIFYLHNLKNKKITITGTNGKSTTSKLLYEIIKKNNKDVRLAGNIGKPLLSEKNIKDNTIFVIEASSYQIEYSKYFRTDFAVILNIFPDHLERHGTFRRYANAKLKLIFNQNKKNISFVNKNVFKLLKNKKIHSKIITVNNFSKSLINRSYNNKQMDIQRANSWKDIYDIIKEKTNVTNT